MSRGRPRKTAKENLPTLVKVETLTLSIKVIHEEPDHTLKKIIPVVSDKEESACKLTIQPPTSPVTHPSSCSSSHPPAAIPVDESSASLPTTSASCVGFESSSSLSSLQNQNSCLDLSTGSTSVPVAKKGKSRSSVSTSQKPKSKRKVASPNHLITEYFSVITRKRKTSKDLKEEEDRHIIYHLEHDIDPISLLAIHEFETKGRGIVALRPIEKGTFICEYRGDLIQMSDAKVKLIFFNVFWSHPNSDSFSFSLPKRYVKPSMRDKIAVVTCTTSAGTIASGASTQRKTLAGTDDSSITAANHPTASLVCSSGTIHRIWCSLL